MHRSVPPIDVSDYWNKVQTFIVDQEFGAHDDHFSKSVKTNFEGQLFHILVSYIGSITRQFLFKVL